MHPLAGDCPIHIVIFFERSTYEDSTMATALLAILLVDVTVVFRIRSGRMPYLLGVDGFILTGVTKLFGLRVIFLAKIL